MSAILTPEQNPYFSARLIFIKLANAIGRHGILAASAASRSEGAAVARRLAT
jgi:hypothetical protein